LGDFWGYRPKIPQRGRPPTPDDGYRVERISAAAGMSRMTLHRRGLSRQDILGAVAARLTDEYRHQAMWSALVAEGNARDRLQTALEAQCRLSERNLATLEAAGHGWSPDRAREGVLALMLDGLVTRHERAEEAGVAARRHKRSAVRSAEAGPG
jgi:AcrR family transcriptional regulator